MELVDLNGIGPSIVKKFEKIGIKTIYDLLMYYPYRYEIIKRSDLNILEDNDKVIIDGIVESIPNIFYFNKKLNKMTFKLNTGTKLLNVSIFNRAFMKSSLSISTSVTVIGKFDKKHSLIIASEIRMGLISKVPKIEPIYHTTNGLTSKQISLFIREAINTDFVVSEYIPDYLDIKYNLLNKKDSIKTIHNPKNTFELDLAKKTLKYEELFIFMIKMNSLKLSKSNKAGIKRDIDKEEVYNFINSLKFKLTEDQLKCVEAIYYDLTSASRMNRLLQGDVGSGKTIVAFIALYINFLSGMQSALMVPTEILANQHYNNLIETFKDYNIVIKLLTGKTKVKEKKEILEGLSNGEIDIIVGTHALISDNVIYNNLSLVITDEQHRFGVNQRGCLKNKGITPDILYMSATPIPRTYALTIYGDMDISSIHTMPNGRKRVITYLKKNSEIKDVLVMMNEELKKKHQVYVICPMIEESDKMSTENVTDLEEKMNKAFSKLYKVGSLHGKMSDNDKEEVMLEFKEGNINILISTTVVEVGVDVPNATMIVIFDAYRFGLSQLHQLRGRVGRNSLQSYCILISSHETERLEVLTRINDGFKVSEEDFKLRGSGDIFGIRQSGDMCFSVANIKNDFNILLRAKEDSLEFLTKKFYLKPEYKNVNDIIQSSINLD
ncbi:MAG: ATP-dependent DNA helicase RecG [Clostridium sp.]|nr:ATP-dependent DNA helicase RecG [Clostridium sp.]MCM1444293.1 ATP-dependent DNA helicase RecG [Candidatus Amulumruptor caecigallinarius]